MKKIRIAFLGPGGSGKTTVIKELESFFKENDFKLFDERPILMKKKYRKYQSNMKKNSFSMQKYFFKERFKQHNGLFKHDRSIIDRDIIDDFIYPRIQIKLNNFSKKQIKKWYEIEKSYMNKLNKIEKIDLAIILHIDFEENIKRIIKRSNNDKNRKEETKKENIEFFKLANYSYLDKKSILYKTLSFSKKYIIINNNNSKESAKVIMKEIRNLLEI